MLNKNEKKAFQNSLNGFFQIDTVRNKIEQENSTLSASKQYKSSLFYIEPISQKVYWETFVNLGLREERIERLVFDKSNDNKNRIDSMSRYYDGKILFSRSGTSLRYTHNGFNVAAGVAAQNYQTIGDFSVAKGEKALGSIDRSFLTFTPNISVDWELPNGKYVSMNYDVSVNQPTSENLQPFADNSNPLYIRKGNPNLLPEVQHGANVSYNMFNAATFFNMMISAGVNYSENQIVYNQKVDEKTLITTSLPENLTGNKSANIYAYTSFPIVKTKLTANFNLSTDFSNSPIFINGKKSETYSQDYNFGGGFSLTPYDFFTLYANSYMSYNKSEFSLSSLSTQEYYDFTNSLETNFKLPHSFFVSSNIRHLAYKNEAADFNRSLAIWNMSVYKLFGKDKKAEIRLTAYDILNQNTGISQSYYQNFAVREVSKTLARYFMLSFSYNMRGMKADIRKNNSW
jgi:hypothetical protein